MPQFYCGKRKVMFSFIGLIQTVRDDGLCEFCIEEVEFLRRDILLVAAEGEKDAICTQLQPCKLDRRNG